MLTIISSAKTLDLKKQSIVEKCTMPRFLREAFYLADELSNYSVEELSSLMNMSIKLGQANYQRYRDFKLNHDKDGNQAIFSFNGDMYKALDIFSYTENEIEFTQNHLRILSGLYGILKPMDIIKEYRLEMGLKLITPKGKDLYEFWSDKITEELKRELLSHKEKCILNLASEEYSKVINRNELKDINFYNIIFKEKKGESYKIVGTYAKKARGLMVSYIMKNSIDVVEEVKGFNEAGYVYREDLSSADNIIFTRE